MATPTYDLLASTTLTSSVTSVTFSSIDQSYGDLILVMNTTGNSSSNTYLQFNGDTSSIYSYLSMYGNGSSSGSIGDSNVNRLYIQGGLGLSGGFQAIYNLQDYSATNKHKTVLGRVSRASQWVTADTGRWASTSAIISILIGAAGSYTYPIGSTFNLYGVAK